VPIAPSTSNFASERVVPQLAIERSRSASRRAWSALLIASSHAPRWAKVAARIAGPPTVRANSSAAPKSMPSVLASAIGWSVVGSKRVAFLPVPETHSPRR